MKVDANWKFNLDSVTVELVLPDSPAAKAGLQHGDSITEVEGCAIPGCGAYKGQSLMEKAIGEPLHLKLKHVNGEAYSAVLIGVPRPAKPTAASKG